MSLVVAQSTENGSRIVSDTRVSFPNGRRPQFKTGTLKAVVVSETYTICFAGDFEKGLGAIRNFAAQLNAGEEIEQLIYELKFVTAEDQRSVEFIIASADPNSLLTKVRDGRVEKNLISTWIGDKDAFERFQQERLKPLTDIQKQIIERLPLGVQVMSKLGDAMDAVIADPKIHSVDDFCVRIASSNGKFNYLGGTFVHVGRDIQIKDVDNLLVKMAQPVEEGGYAVSIVEPNLPGTPTLALNFPRARMGLIFLPLLHDEAQVITNVVAKDFSRAILEKYDVSMNDPIIR